MALSVSGKRPPSLAQSFLMRIRRLDKVRLPPGLAAKLAQKASPKHEHWRGQNIRPEMTTKRTGSDIQKSKNGPILAVSAWNLLRARVVLVSAQLRSGRCSFFSNLGENNFGKTLSLCLELAPEEPSLGSKPLCCPALMCGKQCVQINTEPRLTSPVFLSHTALC